MRKLSNLLRNLTLLETEWCAFHARIFICIVPLCSYCFSCERFMRAVRLRRILEDGRNVVIIPKGVLVELFSCFDFEQQHPPARELSWVLRANMTLLFALYRFLHVLTCLLLPTSITIPLTTLIQYFYYRLTPLCSHFSHLATIICGHITEFIFQFNQLLYNVDNGALSHNRS